MDPRTTLRFDLAHTSSLDVETLGELRRFLDVAFDGEFDAHDWDHTLGGMHAIARDDNGAIVAHGAVVQRRLLHRGMALRSGYVEGVAVRADQRRHGYGRLLLVGLDSVVRGGYELGALSAGPDAGRMYETLGWQRWSGATWAITPDGLVRTPDDDDSTYVLELHKPLDVDGDLACDWRDGDVW